MSRGSGSMWNRGLEGRSNTTIARCIVVGRAGALAVEGGHGEVRWWGKVEGGSMRKHGAQTGAQGGCKVFGMGTGRGPRAMGAGV